MCFSAETSVVLPSASSDLDKIQQPVKVVLSSTCHHAYNACKSKLISKVSKTLTHDLCEFQERSGVQGAAGTGAEPLRVDELREERVHGGVAEFLQIREPQALGRDRVLSVQVSPINERSENSDRSEKGNCLKVRRSKLEK
ncbi:hypothetical protein K0M31_000713 [Melipona bicolor]|uniref:Uncharacterized protein n=1 Tax=Melipona bicolor TaxID=60889 RepID=A0AA40KWZ7_9HYME|nr:hypothetical protein K0M31_000713 [Melipona bicolor]